MATDIERKNERRMKTSEEGAELAHCRTDLRERRALRYFVLPHSARSHLAVNV
jgi:hypothetical protein